MRTKLLLTALPCALALAACSGEAEESAATSEGAYGEETLEAAQPTGAETTDMTDAQELANSDQLDPTYHGVWDYVEGTCDPMSDMRLEITADTLQFYESSGEITGIERESNGDRLVSVSMSGEGESWEQAYRFEMDSSGQFLIVSGVGEDAFDGLPRKRCAG
ncbi:hypothetical protein [Aurantiacibacter sp. MUD61]|uniref:hypothetical protein n=1 Tax=Aurantiacibacter sp. MUD61 TaxID=3009083 RepID=UPI0022EFFACF|nr:hypothetical protein [Aurantiacibacter sp. MUD61]